MEPKASRAGKTNIIQTQPISPHSKAFYDIGKSMLSDSLESGREFCKFMIGSSTGAIPIYLGILTFLLPEDYLLGFGAGGLISLPAIGFLIATIVFSLGYLPIVGKISLNMIDEVEREYNRIILRRSRFILGGQIVFVISTLLAIFTIITNIGVR